MEEQRVSSDRVSLFGLPFGKEAQERIWQRDSLKNSGVASKLEGYGKQRKEKN
jgi:hypothetical protein